MKKFQLALYWLAVELVLMLILWFIFSPQGPPPEGSGIDGELSLLDTVQTFVIACWILISAGLIVSLTLYLRKKEPRDPEKEFALGMVVNMHMVLLMVLMFLSF